MCVLENNYKFKINGMGPISFHTRCDFFCDSHVVLCFSPQKYIDNMVQTCMTSFGTNPNLHKSVRDLLEQEYHTELDKS